MNTNMIHNILNIAIAIQGALIGAMLSTGCVHLPDGGLDCSASWVDPALMGWIMGGMAVFKVAIYIVRDGLGGLWKKQPLVET